MATVDEDRNVRCCASCGIKAEGDDIKLKNCTGCYLVSYCGIKCQKEHRSKHKRDCKKRAAELRDELLFKQPESSHLGDCPICSLPLSLDVTKLTVNQCCSKRICNGCNYANHIREEEARCRKKCLFCREPLPNTEEEAEKLRMKRVEVNDPLALHRMGAVQYNKGDFRSAFEYWTKAAALGDAEAHEGLGCLYRWGRYVEKDEGKGMYHLEEAAIAGHPQARFTRGCYELNDGNNERAMKHFIIAAAQGHDDAMKKLMDRFREGYVSKEDLAATLRAHHATVDAMKSPQRKTAEEYYLLSAEEYYHLLSLRAASLIA